VAAGAILVAGGDSSDGGTPASAESPSSAAAEEGDASPGESEPTGFPGVERTQMAEEIQALLLAYHEDIVERDFTAAWALLSPRKRRQYLGEAGGYRKWMAAQASLSPYLSPAGLAVRLDSLEGDGVARVMLTGMGWSKPGSPCGEWSGLTWARYQGGEWTYDPGYSTTPSRRRTWEPRSSELLGIGC
jgi:hypothetical protein